MATKAEDPAEGAVRLYLMFRSDPGSLRDEAAVKKAQAALEGAKDPVDRLKARADLRAAEAVDGEQYRQDFITHVKAWAEANGVTAKDLLEEGADGRDLAEAGLSDAPKAKGGGRKSSGTKAPRLKLDEDVKPKIPLHEFKVADLAHILGRSPETTRNYITKLLAEEPPFIAKVGEDSSGAGAPAAIYQRVT